MGAVFGSIHELASMMLGLVLVFLLLANADAFQTILNSVGGNWIRMLRVLQGSSK
jgi:hypothetical protein